LFPQSEYFNNTWTYDNISVTHNVSTSPEGLTNAAKIIPNTTSTFHRVKDNEGVASTTFTQSVFAKEDGYDFIALENGGELAFFNLSTGAVGYTSNGTASIEDFGDGWYRCLFTATALNNKSFMYVVDADNNLTFAGDGTKGVLIYGAQYEQGSYPTSYIPTYGSSVTRSGDSTYKNNINSLLGNSGTLFFEIEPYEVNTSTSVFKKILGLFKTNGSVADAIYLEEFNGNWGVWVRKGNSTITSTGYKTTQPTKVAVTFGEEGSRIYFDGVQQAFTAVDTSNEMKQISTQSNAGAPIESVLKVKQLVYFPTELTTTELSALTTI